LFRDRIEAAASVDESGDAAESGATCAWPLHLFPDGTLPVLQASSGPQLEESEALSTVVVFEWALGASITHNPGTQLSE
jgi:hypothetical protein